VSAQLDATVLICSCNRASRLAETLDSLARSVVSGLNWDVIVVDHNSTDETRAVVATRVDRYPVPLRYVFQSQPGKSYALNVGIAATDAAVIAFTEDDVRVSRNWLAAGCHAILSDPSIDYAGGPVLPIWERPAPSWLEARRADLWATLGILDDGPLQFRFEERRHAPVAANVAVRRTLLERLGGFAPAPDEDGESLVGHEHAEFFCRASETGASGVYVPAMILERHVSASRLTLNHFRHWWYWKGASRFWLEQVPLCSEGDRTTAAPQFAGVPRALFGAAARDIVGWVGSLIGMRRASRVSHEVALCYFAGYAHAASAHQSAAHAADRATPATSMRRTSQTSRKEKELGIWRSA
jgi:GT2 family glycosyltransferase